MLIMPNGVLDDGNTNDLPPPILRLAFRPFFWLGALFSILSISVWALSYTGYIHFKPFANAHFWHLHEMLFGFVAAIISGFLLTAVQTWAKVPSVKGWPLCTLVLLWLSARFFMAFPIIPNWLIVALDMSFLPLVAYFFAKPIITAKLWRNLMFVPILLLMAATNGLMFSTLNNFDGLSYLTVSHIMVLLITLVMCILGGRVFPMFTANGTRTPKIEPIVWLEKSSIILVLLSVILVSGLVSVPNEVIAVIVGAAGLANLVRAVRWRIWVTLKTPLVWSLHISYLSICVGLILLAGTYVGLSISKSIAFHVITVGGMGLMILAMTSRVSLGHTGRTIAVGKWMTSAFLMMLIAIVCRTVLPLININPVWIVLSSALFWAIAYTMFVVYYARILFSARPDGGHG